MKFRAIQQIYTPPYMRWVGNGFKVHNFFPELMDKQRMSPFYLLDYCPKMYFPPNDMPQGVNAHPHRGIEMVSLVYQGKIVHCDNIGNNGILNGGDVQWMTTGRGIWHKESHEKTFNRYGGDIHMVQLWINLPRKDKMVEPKYQIIFHDEIPHYIFPNQGIVEVVAGNYHGIRGVSAPFSPMEIYTVKLKKSGKVTITTPAEYNTGLLVLQGSVIINNTATATDAHFVLFENENENISLQAANDDAMALFLSGDPIYEPMAATGPFVMNTEEEIEQAYHDFEEKCELPVH